jgi:hypothetical protein
MPAKEIKFAGDARDRMLRGVELRAWPKVLAGYREPQPV